MMFLAYLVKSNVKVSVKYYSKFHRKPWDIFCIINRHFTGDEQQGSVSIYGNEVHVTTDEPDTRQPVAAGSNRVCVSHCILLHAFCWTYVM